MFKNKFADQIALAVVAMLGENKASYTKVPGAGYHRAQERLDNHRKQWFHTPRKGPGSPSRQVRRNELRRALKDASAYKNRHFAGGRI